jgi:hypothetical protein
LRHSTDGSAGMDATALATKDATLYLDSLISYFRVQANCVATIVPNLNGIAGQRIRGKARDGFRQHRRWFQRHADFDPEYAAILTQHTGWFESLSGDDGWRDDLIHRLGTWQIAVVTGAVTYMHLAIDRPAQPPFPNLLVELRSAVEEYCTFLDAITNHFSRRINAEATTPISDLADERNWGCNFISGGGQGYGFCRGCEPLSLNLIRRAQYISLKIKCKLSVVVAVTGAALSCGFFVYAQGVLGHGQHTTRSTPLDTASAAAYSCAASHAARSQRADSLSSSMTRSLIASSTPSVTSNESRGRARPSPSAFRWLQTAHSHS